MYSISVSIAPDFLANPVFLIPWTYSVSTVYMAMGHCNKVGAGGEGGGGEGEQGGRTKERRRGKGGRRNPSFSIRKAGVGREEEEEEVASTPSICICHWT